MNMKKTIILFLAVLALVGMTKAQDVYVTGISTDEEGHLTAVLYRNGSVLYEHSSDADHVSYSVAANPDNGDVFWTDSHDASGGIASSVFKNNDGFLNVDQAFFAKTCWYPWGNGNPEEDLFTVGYRNGSSGGNYVAVWQGSDATPLYSPGYDNGITSAAADIIAVPGLTGTPDVYYCGNREAEGQNFDIATVWKNDEVLYTLCETSSVAMSMDYYNCSLYTLVLEDHSDYGVLNLYEEDVLLYTLLENTNNYMRTKVKVVGGDIYVYVFCDMGATRVWRNGELLYTYEGVPIMEVDASGFDVTSDGVYYVSMEYDQEQMQGNYFVFKDENVIATFDIYELTQLSDICVVMECADDEARQLPYFESFETGATDWECWTVTDEGENCYDNGTFAASYWHRSIGRLYASPVTGDYMAFYKWNDGANQEGWLISPRLAIPSERGCKLSFYTLEEYYNEMEYEGLWVSTTDSDPSSFTEVWTQTDPYDLWRICEVDLSAYQGQEIYIAFKYAGLDGHSWFIDDVNVVDVPLPPTTVDETEQNKLAVFPDPATESIRLEGLESPCEVQIYNSLGALVKIVTAVPNQEIGIDELAGGLYLLRCGKQALRFVKTQ